jgi:hypothetical protein
VFSRSSKQYCFGTMHYVLYTYTADGNLMRYITDVLCSAMPLMLVLYKLLLAAFDLLLTSQLKLIATAAALQQSTHCS